MMTQAEEYLETMVSFRETVESGQGVRVTKNFIWPGKITQVMFHFPPGCNALVDLRLEKGKQPFYPRQGYLALDNATPVYYVDADYSSREALDFTVLNRDEEYPHSVSCTVVIRYKAKGQP